MKVRESVSRDEYGRVIVQFKDAQGRPIDIQWWRLSSIEEWRKLNARVEAMFPQQGE